MCSTKPSMSSARKSRRTAGRTWCRTTSRSTPMPPRQRDAAAQSRNAVIAEIRSHHPTDRDIAAGLPSWIGGYQQLDRCLQAAEERFIATLRDLERHAAGFGKTLRRVDVIEGEVLAARRRRDGARSRRCQPGRERVAARHAPAATRCATASPRLRLADDGGEATPRRRSDLRCRRICWRATRPSSLPNAAR